jgi:hypothetical protein
MTCLHCATAPVSLVRCTRDMTNNMGKGSLDMASRLVGRQRGRVDNPRPPFVVCCYFIIDIARHHSPFSICISSIRGRASTAFCLVCRFMLIVSPANLHSRALALVTALRSRSVQRPLHSKADPASSLFRSCCFFPPRDIAEHRNAAGRGLVVFM